MLRYQTLALTVSAFALGVAIDRVSLHFDPSHAAPASQGSFAVRNHPPIGERTLDDAVRTTVSMQAVSPQGSMPAVRAIDAAVASRDPLVRADALRRERKFTEAIAAYRGVVATGHMTADAWADFADALASANSSFQGEAIAAINHALALDARHAKALWLKASYQHEQHRYDDAARTWKTLLAVVPPGSSDARIVQANLSEATRLAGTGRG